MLLLAGNIVKAQLEKAQLKGRDIRAVRTGRQVASTVSGRHFPKKSTVVQRFNSLTAKYIFSLPSLWLQVMATGTSASM